jgi:hypothetical protein
MTKRSNTAPTLFTPEPEPDTRVLVTLTPEQYAWAKKAGIDKHNANVTAGRGNGKSKYGGTGSAAEWRHIRNMIAACVVGKWLGVHTWAPNRKAEHSPAFGENIAVITADEPHYRMMLVQAHLVAPDWAYILVLPITDWQGLTYTIVGWEWGADLVPAPMTSTKKNADGTERPQPFCAWRDRLRKPETLRDLITEQTGSPSWYRSDEIPRLRREQ